MKLTVAPPVPPPTYVLELTRDELVRLGKLSYSHEPEGNWDTPMTFFREAIIDDDDEVPPKASVLTDEGTVCGCPVDALHDDCGQDIWTGEWPGERDAIDLDIWCYWDDERSTWVECSRDHPRARTDLNRLSIEGRWDRDEKRWARR